MKKILSVFGTRPEIIKLAPLLKLLDKNFRHTMVYTNQHYSAELNAEIKNDLRLRRCDYIFPSVKGDINAQFAQNMNRLDKILQKERPDFVLVQGDTNSGLLGALVGARCGIRVVHVEAGCRSGNLLAPEEQNRRMIDSISSVFFAADHVSFQNLRKEGVRKNLFLVGNTGLDTIHDALRGFLGDQERSENFALFTLHRMENTLSKRVLKEKMEIARFAAAKIPLKFPLHPRTKVALREFGLKLPPGVQELPPLSYLPFLQALQACRFVLSDSGGIQEEAALLNKPCLVLREETEWVRLIQAKKNFLLPNLDSKAKVLIDRLVSDQKFYQTIVRRKAPGVAPGASAKIIAQIKKL